MPHDIISLDLFKANHEFLAASEETTSVFSAVKSASKSLFDSTKRAGGKGILVAMMAAGTALCAPRVLAQGAGCVFGSPPPGGSWGWACPGGANAPTQTSFGPASFLPGRVTGGDPVDIASGNVFLTVTDYSTAGPNPLQLIRYYNSMVNVPGQIGFVTHALGLGISYAQSENWRTNYDRYLQISPATSPTTVTIERPEGGQITFTGSGSSWSTRTDVDYTLTHSGTTWTLTDHNDTVESYTDLGNGEGQLNTITLRGGYVQTLSYNGLQQLTMVQDSYGRELSFTYSSQLMQSVSTPDSLVLSYGYTGIGSDTALTSVSYNTSPATSQTYTYAAQGGLLLAKITDENGNTSASWTYDPDYYYALSSQLGNSGLGANLTTFSYATITGGTTTTVTNALGVADTYTFSTLQGALKVTGISRASTSTTAAATESFGYDSNGYMNSFTDWNGNQKTTVNNTQGNPTTISEAVGSSVARTTTVSYDTTWVHQPATITTPGLTSTFAYDTSGNPLTRTDTDTTSNSVPYSTNGQTRTTTWTWNGTGEETSIQLPRTDVTAKTTFGYDSTGALTSVADALGDTTNVTSHTGGGYPETIVDPNSVTTTLVWDKRLNLNTSTLATTAGDLVTTWTHDPANRLTSITWPDSSQLTYGYDTANRLTTITDLPGNTITLTLDALGDATATTVKNSSGTTTLSHAGTFDALGRALTDVGGMGQSTSFTWDPNSNLLTVTPPSPSGEVTYTYDALNRLKTRVDPSPGGTTTITLDAHDRPTNVHDANGNNTAYVNDGFGDVIQLTSPDSGITTYTWDPDRNLTQMVKAGSLTTNATYDADDRLLTRTYPSDSTLNVGLTWDQTGHGFGIGRLTSVTDQAGSLSNSFDERGNITSESRVITGVGTLNTSTSFDAAGNVSAITYPSSTGVTYSRNSMGLVTGITATPPGASSASNIATSITYEPFGPVAGLTFGNGMTGTYGYDADYRPTTRADANGSTSIMNLSFGYLSNNSVHTITDSVYAANSQTLGNDALDRLTSATSGTGGYGTFSWTWDPLNNVQTQVQNGTTTTFNLTSGTNQLSSIVTGGTTENVASTAAGNIATLTIGSSTEDTLNYNQANQLANATGTTYAAYTYGFTGERLEKAPSSGYPIVYQYGQAARELLSENDLNSGQTADYIYLNGKPIGEVNPTGGAVYFTHTDPLGTPQALTDSSKTVVWSATYNPFGDTVSFSGTLTTQSLRLQGQYVDPETGMNHNGFRDYAGNLTRYVESDPTGLNGGMNTYQYALGNPFKYTDRFGLNPAQNFGQIPGQDANSRFVGGNSDCGLTVCSTFGAPQGSSFTLTFGDSAISGNQAASQDWGGGVSFEGGAFSMCYVNDQCRGDLNSTAGNAWAAGASWSASAGSFNSGVSTTSSTQYMGSLGIFASVGGSLTLGPNGTMDGVSVGIDRAGIGEGSGYSKMSCTTTTNCLKFRF